MVVAYKENRKCVIGAYNESHRIQIYDSIHRYTTLYTSIHQDTQAYTLLYITVYNSKYQYTQVQYTQVYISVQKYT